MVVFAELYASLLRKFCACHGVNYHCHSSINPRELNCLVTKESTLVVKEASLLTKKRKKKKRLPLCWVRITTVHFQSLVWDRHRLGCLVVSQLLLSNFVSDFSFLIDHSIYCRVCICSWITLIWQLTSLSTCVVSFSFLFCSICLLITAEYFLLKLGLRGFRCQSNICLRFQSALDNHYFSCRLNFC